MTNKGESYGTEFDAFMKDKLDVARAEGINDAFKVLLDGKADYLIAGYYPVFAEAAKDGLNSKGRGTRSGAAHRRNVRRLFQEVALPLSRSRASARGSPR